MEEIQITELDAAKRQLETAIELWFKDADPVSIYTLLAASGSILHNLGQLQGKPLRNYDAATLGIKPEYHNEWNWKICRDTQNFFKHADKDPQGVLTFRPVANEYFIWNCCEQHEFLTGTRPPWMRIFTSWFWLRHPKYFQTIPVEALVHLANDTKSEFVKEMFASLARTGQL